MIRLANLGSSLRDAGRLVSKLDSAIGDVFMCADWVRKNDDLTIHERLSDQLLEAIGRLKKTVETGE